MPTSKSGDSSKSAIELNAYHLSIQSLSITKNFTRKKLDHTKSNWQQWNKQFLITLTLNSLKGYILSHNLMPPHNAALMQTGSRTMNWPYTSFSKM
jgi:uncharacterized membrane protein AbrB (regulator of aidB expression)